MQASIFIAQLLGPIFAVVGVAILLRAEAFRSLLREFIESPLLIYLAGFLGLLAGLTLVLVHNVWLLDWRLIITLIGWLTLIRALVAIFFPQQLVAVGSNLLEHKAFFFGAAALNLIIGVTLCYFGYLAFLTSLAASQCAPNSFAATEFLAVS